MKLCFCALTLAGVFVFCSPSAAQDSPIFRGDSRHSGVYSSPGAPKLSGVKWKFHTAGRIISSPAIVNGTAYIGSTDTNLYAIDIATGTQKWKFATGSWVVSSPAVANGAVYFLSYDSFFYALDAATGQLKWKFQTGGEKRYAGRHLHHLEPAAETMPDPWDFFLSSPLVSNGAVFFGSSDGNVYALGAETGAQRWRFQTGDVVHSSPALVDNTIYIGSWDSYMYGIEAATGKEKGRFRTGDDPQNHNQVGIQSSPLVVDGVLYFGCRDGHAYAVDTSTGKQKWSYSTNGSWVNNSPVVQGDKVYFGTSIPGILHALDAKTGAPLFELPTGSPVFASMTIAGNTLYFGNFGGTLTAVDLTTQKVAWTFQTDGAKQNASTLLKEDGTFKFEAIFPSPNLFYDDMVVAVSKILSLGSILSSPVVVGDTVYFGSADGNLYALH
ncbi:MAG TPA: PQQ-binding-like beta-propeller repeat protein [Dongiaceae bacterium]|nr:PQQ-binding-like beta-propeller repeat protein [Dongiaceae bacterium]